MIVETCRSEFPPGDSQCFTPGGMPNGMASIWLRLPSIDQAAASPDGRIPVVATAFGPLGIVAWRRAVGRASASRWGVGGLLVLLGVPGAQWAG